MNPTLEKFIQLQQQFSTKKINGKKLKNSNKYIYTIEQKTLAVLTQNVTLHSKSMGRRDLTLYFASSASVKACRSTISSTSSDKSLNFVAQQVFTLEQQVEKNFLSNIASSRAGVANQSGKHHSVTC